MDAKTVATFLVLMTTLCVALYISPAPPPKSTDANQVECVEILYRWGDYVITHHEYHRIMLENGVFRTNTGKKIDNGLILSLADSITGPRTIFERGTLQRLSTE